MAMKRLQTITEEQREDVLCPVCGKKVVALEYKLGKGDEVLSHVNCECWLKEIEEEDRRFEAQKAAIDLDKRQKAAGMSRFELKQRFENDDGRYTEATQKCLDYVKRFDKMKEKGRGLLIYGGMGTGKTFMSNCVANALMEKGVNVRRISLVKLLNFRISMDNINTMNEVVETLKSAGLVVIDDYGVERDTPYIDENIFAIIDTLYNDGVPMVITTNLNAEQLRKNPNAVKARSHERILENVVIVRMVGDSRRPALAAQAKMDTEMIFSAE